MRAQHPSLAVDASILRRDFPIFQRLVRGKPLVYLDSAATSQKPLAVIAAMDEYYRVYNANIHRGVYTISEEATTRYEEARRKVATFIGARSAKEVIFVRNATEAINLVAYTWGRQAISSGDEILVTEMEHHSNLVPWQMLAKEKGAILRYVPITGEGRVDMAAYGALLSPRTRLVAITAMSNVLGTITPVQEMTKMAHAAGALVLVDGAQSVPHLPVNVQEIGCDFLAFSGHKMLGPTGSGILWGRREILEEMPPFLCGGDMIKEVTFTATRWNDLPWKFEAGTPAIAEAIGLGVAVDYLTAIGMENIHAMEQELTTYAMECLGALRGVTIYGPPAPERGGVVAFSVKGVHPHDLASLLDEDGVAIRAGHHCAMPLHSKLGISASARASMYLYNLREDIDRLVQSIERAQRIFGV